MVSVAFGSLLPPPPLLAPPPPWQTADCRHHLLPSALLTAVVGLPAADAAATALAAQGAGAALTAAVGV
jgi:hypothetical protein